MCPTVRILNRDCNIICDSVTKYWTIEGYVGSTAETFAYSNGIKFNTIPEPTNGYLCGDTNCDGEVFISDAVLIMQSICNPDEYKIMEQGIENADTVNMDGITGVDALAIKCVEANIFKSEGLSITSVELQTHLDEINK